MDDLEGEVADEKLRECALGDNIFSAYKTKVVDFSTVLLYNGYERCGGGAVLFAARQQKTKKKG